MENYDLYFAANKKLWNNKTAVHVASDFYNLAQFKAGATSLNPVELAEMPDVKGKSLLHLQCHFGMDTISFARMGATATGLDLSDAAIAAATELAASLEANASFVCANVYDANEHLSEKFDIVFTSYGTIGWLPDLNRWAAVIKERLKPGSIFYMVDFHPVVWMFDDNFSFIKYSYFNTGEPIVEQLSGTYADRQADLHDTEYGWNHSLSEIISALLNAGLTLEFFHEHLTSPYNCFNNTVEVTPGAFQIKGMEGKIPMLYSMKFIN
ncbi:Methyltransferase domain-containing protein [Chitinophaga jiangningensis]|uniref:Methyltransferase domain-containing protein n=1 Tax=Chitinophaga jiangningensis TaxID=1419482 RepID=A0A1M7N4S0_9BACT|nr:class I SAM-dependent methyltransferase [Chitinophaga jiangningensis]SHM98425.1 Methyltransferase domain-containing protein [Chitinophaga jiangningensis]